MRRFVLVGVALSALTLSACNKQSDDLAVAEEYRKAEEAKAEAAASNHAAWQQRRRASEAFEGAVPILITGGLLIVLAGGIFFLIAQRQKNATSIGIETIRAGEKMVVNQQMSEAGFADLARQVNQHSQSAQYPRQLSSKSEIRRLAEKGQIIEG